MLPGIMKRVREKEKTEDESGEQKIKARNPEGVRNKNVRTQGEFEASGKGISLKGEAFNL